MLSKTAMSREILAHGKRVSLPISLDPVRHKGFSVVGVDNNLYVSNGVSWNQVYTFDPGAPPITAFTVPVEFTVGTGGDFNSIGKALEHLSTFLPYASADFAITGIPRATVRILSGHVVNEQVYLNSVNLSWVTIIADDATVDVEPTGLINVLLGIGDAHPLFFADASNMPGLAGIIFNLLAGTIPQDPLVVANSGPYTPKAELFSVRSRSVAELSGAFEDDGLTYRYVGVGTGTWGYGASVANQSTLRIIGGKFEDVTETAVACVNFAELFLIGVLATRAGVAGLSVSSSRVSITNGILPIVPAGTVTSMRKVDGVDGSSDLTISSGSIVQRSVGTLGGANIEANTLLINGVYFYNDGVPVIFDGIIKPKGYTVSTVPAASLYPAQMIYVSNGDSGSPCYAVSNGTNWLRIPFGAAISI